MTVANRKSLGSRLRALLPTIWHALTLRNLTGWPPEKSTRDTAWLDGLRGVSAFLVMIGHFGLTFWRAWTYDAPFGANDVRTQGGPDNPRAPLHDIWRLPILRVWFSSGHAQVAIFFILSGFVLSWGSLRSMRQGQTSALGSSLGSSVFRRWIRLYLPCFAVAFWQMLELRVGLRGNITITIEKYLYMQVWDFIKYSAIFANPFTINRDDSQYIHKYDWTMWTIPHEYAGSLLVYLTVLGVSRCNSQRKRTAVLLLLAVTAHIAAQWDFWLFATGVLFANYVVARGGFAQLGHDSSFLVRTVWVLVLIVGLLMAGIPPKAREYYDRHGYDWLDRLVPKAWEEHEGGLRLWWCWAGILCVTSCAHLPLARKFFELPLMRYMGRISYMLYLLHRVVLNLVGQPLTEAVYKPFGRTGYIDFSKAGDGKVGGNFAFRCITFLIYLILLLVMVPLTFLVSHWGEVLIDAPSTRLARSVDNWFSKSGEEKVEETVKLDTLPSHAVHLSESPTLPPSRSRATDEAEYEDEPLLAGDELHGEASERQHV
ncbi:hypothetical protein B0A48_03138 [Cryoendolithus antarcticus]|uniref:Acyltransferase 3 domain-containing protein n=1 Tax=Cryoendolithus antarcticus TaxID=1507870 RepID=A0A1V8TMA3_9PEZI|nr:hypothetical protein B0A48_03138 [Cryoendolithus antarcticus]